MGKDGKKTLAGYDIPDEADLNLVLGKPTTNPVSVAAEDPILSGGVTDRISAISNSAATSAEDEDLTLRTKCVPTGTCTGTGACPDGEISRPRSHTCATFANMYLDSPDDSLPKIKLEIRLRATGDNRTFSVEVDKEDTILELKENLRESEGISIPCEKLHLIFDEHALVDKKTIADYPGLISTSLPQVYLTHSGTLEDSIASLDESAELEAIAELPPLQPLEEKKEERRRLINRLSA